MSNVVPFNPLDKKNLGASVAEAMLNSSAQKLGALHSFNGAGVYAIYYSGKFSPYKTIAARNQDLKNPEVPIYVGKAIPSGGRKGVSLTSESTSKALFSRLKEHADSILLATDSLDIDDFTCRYLVVDDIWIPLGEALLIAKFSPLWNNFVDGFGNHDPGKGRYEGMRPRWDVLHPGRAWAARCKPRLETKAEIEKDVSSHLRSINLPADTHVLKPKK
jgi:hypothetical protein